MTSVNLSKLRPLTFPEFHYMVWYFTLTAVKSSWNPFQLSFSSCTKAVPLTSSPHTAVCRSPARTLLPDWVSDLMSNTSVKADRSLHSLSSWVEFSRAATCKTITLSQTHQWRQTDHCTACLAGWSSVELLPVKQSHYHKHISEGRQITAQLV